MTPTPTTGTSGSHSTHARFNASGSSTWIPCEGAIFFAEANLHRQKPNRSVWSDEGTVAHDYASDVLKYKILIEDVPEDFRPYVEFYVDYCESLIEPGFKILVEEACPLFYSKGETGVADFVALSAERLIVRDLKYGQGELVEAERNSQLGIYGMSVVEHFRKDFNFTSDTIIDLGIVQPRHHGGDPIRVWVLTLGELIQFLEDELDIFTKIEKYNRADAHFRKSFAAHLQNIEEFNNGTLTTRPRDVSEMEIEMALGLTFNPSPKACRWCKARHFCKRKVDANLAPVGFDVLADLPDLTKEEKKLPVADKIEVRLGTFPDEDMVKLWSNRKAITSLLDDIEEYLQVRAESGNPAPGTKLVSGREGNRKWADEDAAEKFLAGSCKLKMDERFKFTLISPTQAEKLIADKLQSPRSKAKFLSLVSRSDGRPVVALEDDKRPAISASVDGLDDETICDDL